MYVKFSYPVLITKTFNIWGNYTINFICNKMKDNGQTFFKIIYINSVICHRQMFSGMTTKVVKEQGKN